MMKLARCSWLFLATVGLAGGCAVDASDRCGSAMEYDATLNACVCVPNAVISGLGCTPCADDETVVSGSCACAPGSAKNAENVCERVVGLGDACDATSTCTNDKYSYCAPSTAGVATSNTCTAPCTSDADCDAAYTCATWEAQPYCREFAGFGKSCGTSADCADTDAKYCDTFQTHTCVVNGCSLETSDCPKGTMCCDFSNYGLGTLCAEACQ